MLTYTDIYGDLETGKQTHLYDKNNYKHNQLYNKTLFIPNLGAK